MRTELEAMPLILMHHSISPYDEDPCQVTVAPQRFGRQLQWLSRRGLRGVSVRELLDACARGRSRGLVGLTFDDGYEDLVTHALPALDHFGFTATAFVVAGRLGATNVWSTAGPSKPLLTADQLGKVVAAGVEIGSHGLTHVCLSTTSENQLAEEVADSRTTLQEITGQEVRGFCYPYGVLTERVVKAVRAAGYDYACAIWRSELTGRHALTRTYIHDRDCSWRLDAKRVRHALTARGRFRLLQPTPVGPP